MSVGIADLLGLTRRLIRETPVGSDAASEIGRRIAVEELARQMRCADVGRRDGDPPCRFYVLCSTVPAIYSEWAERAGAHLDANKEKYGLSSVSVAVSEDEQYSYLSIEAVE